MKEVSALLCAKPQFVRCHQSFVVNMSFIKGVEGLEIVLNNGEHIPISQPRAEGIYDENDRLLGDML